MSQLTSHVPQSILTHTCTLCNATIVPVCQETHVHNVRHSTPPVPQRVMTHICTLCNATIVPVCQETHVHNVRHSRHLCHSVSWHTHAPYAKQRATCATVRHDPARHPTRLSMYVTRAMLLNTRRMPPNNQTCYWFIDSRCVVWHACYNWTWHRLFWHKRELFQTLKLYLASNTELGLFQT